jgi:hypothetical protein
MSEQKEEYSASESDKIVIKGISLGCGVVAGLIFLILFFGACALIVG